ncbi:hypothetical protein D9M69_510770 [compost metagenome]
MSLLEDGLERVHLGQVVDGLARVGKGEPEAVADAEARVAVQRDAERAAQQFAVHHVADRLALRFQRVPEAPAVPGQARAQALTSEQVGHFFPRLDRGVAHQVHAARIGPRRGPHAAGVDDGHEHQAHAVQQAVQRGVPRQPRDDVLQEGDDHLGADALQSVHAAEVAHRRHIQAGVAQGDGVHGKAAARWQRDPARLLHLQMGRAQLHDFFQSQQLGQGGFRHGVGRWCGV